MSNNSNDPSKGTNGDDNANSKDIEKKSNEETEKRENEIENYGQTDGKELCEVKVEKDEPTNKTKLNINVDENVRRNSRKTWTMFIFGRPVQSPPQNGQQNIQQFPQQNPQQNPPAGSVAIFFPEASATEENRPPPLAYKPETRNGFVRLVLCIVLIMLIVTAGFVTFIRLNESARNFFLMCPSLLIFLPALLLMIIVNYAFVCSSCARVVPCNIFMLFLTVVAMTLITATITIRFRTDVIIYAVLSTAGIVAVCLLLAFSKFDFTRCMLYIIVISAAFGFIVMIVLIVRIVTGAWMKPVVMLILAVGTLLEAVLLVVELQMVLGGKSIEISEQDYAVGAYMIYSSIVDIFLKMGLLIDIGR